MGKPSLVTCSDFRSRRERRRTFIQISVITNPAMSPEISVA